MGKLKIGYRGLDTDGDEFTVVAKAGKGYRDVQYHTGIAAVGIVTERMGNDYLLGGGPVANDNASISPEISGKAYSGDGAVITGPIDQDVAIDARHDLLAGDFADRADGGNEFEVTCVRPPIPDHVDG